MEGGRSGSGDGGFTLVELLVVIVILGILATVTVFAVREITSVSAETACATELDNLEKAEEAHFTVTGNYADEATLLASGVIKAASSMYDIASDDSTYTITVASGATCTSGATGGSSSGATGGSSSGTPPVVAMGPSESHHGVTAWRYPDGDQGSAPDQILVFGGAGGRADWVAADTADITTTRRTHFFDIDAITPAQVDTVLGAADNSGVTTIVVYAADDAGTIAAYVQGEVGNYNATNVISATFGSGQLASLLAST